MELVKMRGINSLLNREKKDLTIQDDIHASSSSNVGGLSRGQLELDDLDKSKMNGGVELSHLEYTVDLNQMDDENVENQVLARVMNAAEDAKENDEEEKEMTLWQALKRYPKAAAWSLLVSTTLIMEGYDTTLLSSFFALPVFQQKFGTKTKDGIYEIPSQWQIGLNMCVSCGEILGLQMTGFMVERIGNRFTMIIALCLLCCYIFILYFCKSLAMIAVGQILSAMPWGCFQSVAVTYASEVCPLALRYYMTSYSNMCWLFGQIFASGIMKNSQENLANSDMGYKLPFALQWIWPPPLALGIFLAPESPWWLVKKGRIPDAKRALNRILSGKGEEKETQVKMTLEKMRLTIEKEKLTEEKSGSVLECFRGVNLRRTRIACLTWIVQNSSGSVLLGYSTYFFEKAGMATSSAFTFSIIQYCLGLAGTMCSWYVSGWVGRWTILVSGLAFQMVILFIIGGLGFSSNSQASYGSGGLLLALGFFYNLGIGAVVYCIVAEIPSARLRTLTIVLARNSYNLVGVINAILTPYMLNTENWNWGAKTGLYWGGITAFSLLWAVIDLPETSGRTFGEINELFAQGIPARKFRDTKVDPFGHKTIVQDLKNEVSEQEMASFLEQEEDENTSSKA